MNCARRLMGVNTLTLARGTVSAVVMLVRGGASLEEVGHSLKVC